MRRRRLLANAARVAALGTGCLLVASACADTTTSSASTGAVNALVRPDGAVYQRPVEPTAPDPLWVRIHKMTLLNKVRQLVVLSFSGPHPPTHLIDTVHPGGLIYFSGNLTSQTQ